MADIKVPKTEEAYINDIYNKQKESTLRTLKSAYDNNISSIDTAQKALEANAYETKRETAGDAAITRQKLNETFAANGLNTGTVGQANLALLNQKAANLNKIDLAKQQAQQEYESQKAALMQAYQSEVKTAIQGNDAQKAQALYAAWKEQQAQANALATAQAQVQTAAKTKTSTGSGTGTPKKTVDDDFSDNPTANKGAASLSTNPYNTGNAAIDKAQYDGLVKTIRAYMQMGNTTKARQVLSDNVEKLTATQYANLKANLGLG